MYGKEVYELLNFLISVIHLSVNFIVSFKVILDTLLFFATKHLCFLHVAILSTRLDHIVLNHGDHTLNVHRLLICPIDSFNSVDRCKLVKLFPRKS